MKQTARTRISWLCFMLKIRIIVLFDLLFSDLLVDALPSILDGGQYDLHGSKLTVHSEEEDEAEEDC